MQISSATLALARYAFVKKNQLKPVSWKDTEFWNCFDHAAYTYLILLLIYFYN